MANVPRSHTHCAFASVAPPLNFMRTCPWGARIQRLQLLQLLMPRSSTTSPIHFIHASYCLCSTRVGQGVYPCLSFSRVFWCFVFVFYGFGFFSGDFITIFKYYCFFTFYAMCTTYTMSIINEETCHKTIPFLFGNNFAKVDQVDNISQNRSFTLNLDNLQQMRVQTSHNTYLMNIYGDCCTPGNRHRMMHDVSNYPSLR